MGVLRMKMDLQQAIANKIHKYETNYNSLVFEDENWEYFKTFYLFKRFKIKVKNNQMYFEVELNNEKLKEITKEELEKIKELDFKNRFQECLIQQMVSEQLSNNAMYEIVPTVLQKEITENEKTREPSSIEKIKMEEIQRILKEKINIETQLKIGEAYFYLESNLKEIEFTEEKIEYLFDIVNEIDNFSITPIFKNDEEIDGIRLFFGIDLTL